MVIEKNEYPKSAGIYKFTCRDNGKIYIGKSVNLYNRIKNHKKCSHKTIGKCYFENALIKYGWSSFDVEILEIIENFDKKMDNKSLLFKESEYINKFDSTNKDKGYNVCKFSNDSTGISKPPRTDSHRRNISLAKRGVSNGPHTKESIEKMRLSKLGKKRPEFSKEWKENIGKGHRGLKMPEEAKQKISAAHKGRPKSKEAVEKMRQSLTGRTLSEEHVEKIRMGNIGKTHSEETKEHLRNINNGRKMSREAREKMSNAQKGNNNASGKRSEETKQKMRASRLAFLEKQRKLNEQA